MEFDDVLVGVPDTRIERLQRQFLETLHRNHWIGVDSDGVPGFENLRPQMQDIPRVRAELERRALGAETADERRDGLHSPPSVATARGTRANVAKKRATC